MNRVTMSAIETLSNTLSNRKFHCFGMLKGKYVKSTPRDASAPNVDLV